MSIKFTINGRAIDVDVPSDTPLLWVVRDELDLKGTKFGCGIGLCGACTVHVEGSAQRSCITPVSQIAGKQITTIEGLGGDGPHPLQKAWVEAQAPQCGYCQSGQIMQAATLLAQNPEPTDAEITASMNGNLCRCMTYGRIKSAIKIAAKEMKGGRENV
ncbi:MAG: isoquinoline 1-oxidoreductase alpha subunit [Cyclobacteriaceae bacterium]|jgi:isoquinoline 1-oxidoreductase alpha subunit